MVLATKGGIVPPAPYDSSATYLRAACEASLRRLRCETLDLYQIHRPDLLAHPEEVAGMLDELVTSGKVRAIGVSNHTVGQTRALQAWLWTPLASSQPEFSPLALDPITDGTLDLAWRPASCRSPGARSAAAGSAVTRPDRPAAVDVARVCDRIAADWGVTRSAVLLAWAMRHPAGVVPIIGTQQLERIRECARAARGRADVSEWYEILVAARGESMP